jgi:hypothetical protein
MGGSEEHRAKALHGLASKVELTFGKTALNVFT